MSGVLARPANPGTYIGLVGEQTVRPPSSISQVVAIPIVHDWGPLGSDSEGIQRLGTFGEFEQIFGSSSTAGRDAIMGAFVGPGVSDKAAAGEVVTYRMAKEAAASTLTIKNTAAENALKLTGYYTGKRGDRISIKTEDDPVDATKDRISILFDGVVVERYSFTEATITEAVTLINASSKLVKAESLKTGVNWRPRRARHWRAAPTGKPSPQPSGPPPWRRWSSRTSRSSPPTT